VKSQLHDEYVKTQMKAHDVHWPEIRAGAIIGVAPGNIGEAIAERLFQREEWQSVAGTNEKSHNCMVPEQCINFLTEAGQGDPGAVDTLIICAAETHLDWIEDYPYGAMVEVIHNTLLCPMVATQQFVRTTLNTPWVKHIVYIGSMAYNKVLNASAPYCAAKAGLAHFARCMAWELGPKGYRVFTVHPGNVLDTPMSMHTIGDISRYRTLSIEEAEQYWASAEPPMGFLTRYEIAVIVSDLVSDSNESWRHVSGSQIELAGGSR
jgi:NAD(P)-dependent dehydrogenase (short-subunit alcohol dehydrogenase family)